MTTDSVQPTKTERVVNYAINIGLIIYGIVWIVFGAFILSRDLIQNDFKAILDEIRVINGLHSALFAMAIFPLVIGVFLILYIVAAFYFALKYPTDILHSKKGTAIVFSVFGIIIFFATTLTFSLWTVIRIEVGRNDAKVQMVNNLHREFRTDRIDTDDSISKSWNLMFMELHCCAVNPVVSTINDFDLTPWCTTSGECQQTNSQIPKTCCKNVEVSNYLSAPSTCHANVDDRTYNSKGCYEILEKKIHDYWIAAFTIGISTIILEIGFGILAVLSVCKTKRCTEVLKIAFPAAAKLFSVTILVWKWFTKDESYAELTQEREIELLEVESDD